MEEENNTAVNITVKIPFEQVNNFENWLKGFGVQIVDYKILPNVDKLRELDSTFKVLDKVYRNAKKTREKYINKHN